MDISLDTLQPGERAVVTALHCSQALRARLADFGLVAGTEVKCRCRALGIAALELRGTVLAMRSRDLGSIAARRP